MGERKRPKQVGLMLSEAEFAALKRSAEDNRMAVGTYIRNRLFTSNTKAKKEEERTE